MLRLRVARTTIVAVVAVLGACHDDRPFTPSAEPAAMLPAGAAQTTIRQISVNADGSTTFAVRVLTRELAMSAFQGTLRFKPGTLELVNATTPTGENGDRVFVLNSSKFGEGKIMFAGLTPSVFGDSGEGEGFEAFRFTVRAVGAIADAQMVASLDVVGKDTGTPVAADMIFASPGVRDLSGQLIR